MALTISVLMLTTILSVTTFAEDVEVSESAIENDTLNIYSAEENTLSEVGIGEDNLFSGMNIEEENRYSEPEEVDNKESLQVAMAGSEGMCGKSVKWQLYGDEKLVISGTGEMDNFF